MKEYLKELVKDEQFWTGVGLAILAVMTAYTIDLIIVYAFME